MGQISILIVDDDFAKITSIIKQVREVFSETLDITQASSVQEAIENLQKKEFHLMITDFQMPLREGDAPDDNGGLALLKSLYKKKTAANLPLYIVGLTQFDSLKISYKGVWKVWHYSSELDEWRENIRDLIHHISLIKSRVIYEKKETIFLEGPTDKNIVYTAFKFYYAEYLQKINIEMLNYGGGASWVERQLFIWGKSLVRKSGSEKYLKAVGIFDDDQAGNTAIQKIRSQIPLESAESKTFCILKNCFKYSVALKAIKAKGITFPTTVEDLFPFSVYALAKEKGWLTTRPLQSILVDPTLLPLNNSQISEDILLQNGFTSEEILLSLYRVDDHYKGEFNKYVLSLSKDCFIYVSYLLKDVITKLGVTL